MVVLLALVALAEPASAAPVTLAVGIGPIVAPPSVGVTGSGRVVFRFGKGVAIEAVGSEGYASRDSRVVGSIGFFVRYEITAGAYVRGGFEHHHETPWEAFGDGPFGSLLGTGSGIRHRSGFELAGGIDRPFRIAKLQDRLGGYTELALAVMPDAFAPDVYLTVELGITLDVGRQRSDSE